MSEKTETPETGWTSSKVYIVTGTTGDFDDAREWSVRGFLNENLAVALCTRLNAWCKEHHCSQDEVVIREGPKAGSRPPEDTQFMMNSGTGTKYYVNPVPLDEAQMDELILVAARRIKELEEENEDLKAEVKFQCRTSDT